MFIGRLLTVALVYSYSANTIHSMEVEGHGANKRMLEETNSPLKEKGMPAHKRRRATQEESAPARLFDQLTNLSKANAQAFQKADTPSLDHNYERFKQLTQAKDWSDHDWQQAVRSISLWIVVPYTSNPIKGPSQTDPRQIIGGHLFYPPDMNQLLASYYTESLVERRDHIRGLIIATKYHNPVSEYYLTQRLAIIYDRSHEDKDVEGKPPVTFFDDHFKHALQELEQCTEHPDACYILGQNYGLSLSAPDIVEDDERKALQLFIKGGDARNKLEALLIRKRYIRVFSEAERPTIEDFLKLAEQENYGPAYVEAAEMVKDLNKKIDYLTKAVDICQFYPAYIDLGYVYRYQGNREQTLVAFENAGKHDVPHGYILCAALIGDNIQSFPLHMPISALKKLSGQDREKVAHYFRLAGEAQDPEGWLQLASFYFSSARLVEADNDKKSLRQLGYEALEEGIKLGSINAYERVSAGSFAYKLPELIKKYGPVITIDYHQEVERQLQEK